MLESQSGLDAMKYTRLVQADWFPPLVFPLGMLLARWRTGYTMPATQTRGESVPSVSDRPRDRPPSVPDRPLMAIRGGIDGWHYV